MNWLVILQMIIFSDGVGALVGARGAWQLESRGRKVEFFVVCAFALLCYSVSAFLAGYNSVVHGPERPDYPDGFLERAIAFRLLQAAGIWTLALAMIGGERGMIMKIVGCLVTKFQGKPLPDSRSGELPPEHWEKRFDALEKKLNGKRSE